MGTEETLLNINMLADKKKDDYCGVFINEKSEERSVAVAVIVSNRNKHVFTRKPKLGFLVSSWAGDVSQLRALVLIILTQVRIHKTLELADDKFYMITCGKAGFQVFIIPPQI